MAGSLIGVGPALRKARMRRGVTIDEASRGTRIRADSLEALEREDFDALLGEVYVRGALRTYAGYLGLDPEKVLEIYGRGGTAPAPTPAAPPTQLQGRIRADRRRDNHRLAWAVVAIVVICAVGFGVLSRSGSSPTPATVPRSPVPVEADAANVVVGVTSSADLTVGIAADGIEETVQVRRGEERTFEAGDVLQLTLTDGGPATITVNGTGPIVVARGADPWSDTFSDTSIVPPSEEDVAKQGRAIEARARSREDAVSDT